MNDSSISDVMATAELVENTQKNDEDASKLVDQISLVHIIIGASVLLCFFIMGCMGAYCCLKMRKSKEPMSD